MVYCHFGTVHRASHRIIAGDAQWLGPRALRRERSEAEALGRSVANGSPHCSSLTDSLVAPPPCGDADAVGTCCLPRMKLPSQP